MESEEIVNPCVVCGEELIILPGLASGISQEQFRNLWCPYFEETWHKMAIVNPSKRSDKLYLQRRRKEPLLIREVMEIAANKMPEGQGKRDKKRPSYNYIPLEFLDELASIFEEGRKPRPGMPEGYGDSWKKGGKEFLTDCLNHATWHQKMYEAGDRSENHLAKIAWNVLVVRYFDILKEKESDISK